MVDTKKVIFETELCKMRIAQKVSTEKSDELYKMIAWIDSEYDELWNKRNY